MSNLDLSRDDGCFASVVIQLSIYDYGLILISHFNPD